MGKLLRILTVIVLVLSIAALALGWHLFGKREQLKGRTQKLENAIIALGTFVEAESAEPQPATFPAKDVSECTAEELARPEQSDFWRRYEARLEKPNQPTLDLGQRRGELMNYYLKDPVTQKIMRDELGYRQTKGKGTMQYLLDELLGKAEEQLRRLNETRSQLASVRQELVTTIEELNQRKASLRSSLGEIAQLRQTVTEKDTQIAELGDQVQQLEEDKRGLEDEIAGQKNLIAKIEEEKRDLEEEVVALEKRLKGVPPPVDHPAARKVDPGIKGRVASVNRDWNFAIVSLNDEFLRGVLGEDLAGEFQPVELLVKRADVAGDFVTKVRITQVKRDKRLGIADILSEWQQAPVMAGDIVFY